MNLASIKERVQEFILTQQYGDADSKLLELEAIFPEDPDLYAMRAFMYFQQGQTHQARTILEKAIQSHIVNDDILFSRAQIYELDREFLRAVELYESLLFKCQIEEERAGLLEHLNELQELNQERLEQELADEEIGDAHRLLRESLSVLHVHLLYDSQYCDNFIRMVNEGMDATHHVFLIVANRNQEFSTISEVTLKLPGVIRIDIEDHLNQLIEYLSRGSAIYIHFLFDYICELICKLDLKANLNWVVWGADLYNYVDYKLYDQQTSAYLSRIGLTSSNQIDKKTLSYYYRKSAVRRISRVLTLFDGDFDILKRNFMTKAKRYDFSYPNFVDFVHLTPIYSKRVIDYQHQTTILLGNSANPSNQHIELIDMIAPYKDENIKVIMPLSYGGFQPYIDGIVKLGKETFGDKFTPILNLLDLKQYADLLADVDIALFNNLRQQAVGNIIALLYMGKKVFINPAAITFDYFKKLGVNIHDIHSIEKLSYAELNANIVDVQREQRLISSNWSKHRSLELFLDIVDINEKREG